MSLIKKLLVQNIFLLESLELEFTSGLNVLTGETGAGKSILLDCLGYLLGKKNTRIELSSQATSAVIIGEFQIQQNGVISQFLSEKGFSVEDNLILRQSIGANRKRRAFLNDLPCSLDMVRQLGDLMLDLNGQFEEQGLLNVNTHRALLDAFGNLQESVRRVEKSWTEILELKKQLENEFTKKDLVENRDFLAKSIKGIIELKLDKAELDTMEENRDKLRNASRSNSGIMDAFENLNRDLVEENILNVIKSLEKLERKGYINDELPTETFYAVLEKFAQACEVLENLKEKSANSEHELIKIEDRYHAIKRICRTHDVELDQILNLQTSLEHELQSIEGVDEKIKKIEKKIFVLEEEFKKEVSFLSNQRQEVASKLDQKIEKELKPLKLELAKFKTDILATDNSKFGCDHVCFTTEINPGSGFKPLNKIASGGELSRFLLAVKLCFLRSNSNKTQIFDEIDRGLGGATASAIGKRLLQLSEHEQVLVVTHSPQVAAYSDNHLKVEKINRDNLTNTKVNTLDEKSLIEEIARMLSGELISSEALAAAATLRNSSRNSAS
ncbi:MAG: DNA repair protein RecN [Alphaproteobacteria bacterium]|nr:MAG: DNA repair protein RecN [Alphaproteobacteria bacterium]